MSLDKGAPSRHPLGRIAAIGAPMHGVVQSGTLTLPTAATMAHPQPANTNTWAQWHNLTGAPWMGAATYYVKRPGWAMAARTAEQLAADAAAGREWRDWAMLSGVTQYYAGQELNGWVYFDETGAAWAVELTSITGTVAAAQMAFTFTRVGQFSSNPAAPANRTTPAFDLGQSGAPTLKYRPVKGDATIGGMVVAAPEVVADMICVSQTPDGSKSLWMRSIRHYAKTLGGEELTSTAEDRPIAFIEVTVGPAKAVTAETIRTRAQCMGTVVIDSWTATFRSIGFLLTSTPPTVIGTCEGISPPQNIVQETFTAVLEVLENEISSEVGSPRVYTVPGPDSASGGLTGQTLAMWYDTAGTLHEISVDVTHLYTRTSSGSGSASGTVFLTTDCPGPGSTYTGSNSWERTDNFTLTETLHFQLLDNGVVIPGAEKLLERTASGSYARSFTTTDNTFGPMVETTTGTDTITIDGATAATGTGADIAWTFTSTGAFFNYFGTPGDDAEQTARQFDTLPFLVTALPDGATAYSISSADSRWWLDAVRWSNAAMGFREEVSSAGSAVFDRHDFGPSASAAGVVAHAETFSTPGVRSRVTCSGSLQPVSAELATVVTNESTAETHNPKCWV